MEHQPNSIPDFKRGRYVGLIVAVVVVLVGVAAVLALSGVFETKTKRYVEPERRQDVDNKEGGCPCNCDRSKAMAAELRALGGKGALASLDESLSTIAEREEAGFVTEAMIQHRLRLLGVERELAQAGTIPIRVTARPEPFAGIEHHAVKRELLDGGTLRVGMELAVHGQMKEWVKGREKLQLASFVLMLDVENLSDTERRVKPPVFESDVKFPVSRWYVRGENGEPWDGKLKAGERKSLNVIGYVGEPIPPKAAVSARIRFESTTFHATTRARSRWDRVEPTRASL